MYKRQDENSSPIEIKDSITIIAVPVYAGRVAPIALQRLRRLKGNNAPAIDSITVNKVGKVRRAKLYYLRALTGKKARIQEKRVNQ